MPLGRARAVSKVPGRVDRWSRRARAGGRAPAAGAGGPSARVEAGEITARVPAVGAKGATGVARGSSPSSLMSKAGVVPDTETAPDDA